MGFKECDPRGTMPATKWTIHSLLKVAAEYLKEKGIESPRLTAELLLAYQLNTDRVTLYLFFDRPLNEEELSGYRALLRRRLQREPTQHIIGLQEFWSMDFIVGARALIPRPESEILIEKAVALFSDDRIPGGWSPRVLDLGTGSGVLAVSIAREIEGATVFASDISSDALALAGENAKKHGVEERVRFVEGDLFDPLREKELPFDLILSNPPYIAVKDLDTLPREVRDYEPRIALDGGDSGMDYVEKIIREAPAFLNPGGWVLVEMDPEQTGRALSLINEDSRYLHGERIKDYSHRYRVVYAQRTQGNPASNR